MMSYGGSVRESYQWASIHAGRILKGEKPADPPVQQSTAVELIVNLETANTLGVSVPLSCSTELTKLSNDDGHFRFWHV